MWVKLYWNNQIRNNWSWTDNTAAAASVSLITNLIHTHTHTYIHIITHIHIERSSQKRPIHKAAQSTAKSSLRLCGRRLVAWRMRSHTLWVHGGVVCRGRGTKARGKRYSARKAGHGDHHWTGSGLSRGGASPRLALERLVQKRDRDVSEEACILNRREHLTSQIPKLLFSCFPSIPSLR